MRLPFFLVSGVLIGFVLHIVSLLAVPLLAPRDFYNRLAELGGENTGILLEAAESDKKLPFLDPGFVHLGCRFNLTSGPVSVRVPLAGPYVSISFHDRDGTAFFSLNDRSALGSVLDAEIRDEGDAASKALPLGAGTISVSAPGAIGFVLVRAFVPSPSAAGQLRTDLAKTACAPRS